MPKPLMSVPAAAAWLGLTAPMLQSEMARHVDPLPYVEMDGGGRSTLTMRWPGARGGGTGLTQTLANDATPQSPDAA